MPYKYPTTKSLFKAICNSIRNCTGETEDIKHQDIPDEINKITNKVDYIISSILDQSIVNFNSNTAISVPNSGFADCNALESINFSEAISIGSNAFSNCTSLESVNLPKATTIDIRAFGNCSSLKSIDLPEAIDIGMHVFNSCSALESINLPEATNIDSYAFENCSSLKSIDLPKVTGISRGAFRGCTNLTKVILRHSDKVVDILNSYRGDYSLFSNTPIANGDGYVYVPDSLIDSYCRSNWMYCECEFKPLSELPE